MKNKMLFLMLLILGSQIQAMNFLDFDTFDKTDYREGLTASKYNYNLSKREIDEIALRGKKKKKKEKYIEPDNKYDLVNIQDQKK